MGSSELGDATGRLGAAVNDLDKKQARLKRAVADFKKGAATDPCATHRWLEANKDLIAMDAPSLLELAAEVERRCRDAMLRFEAELREAVTNAGYSITGQWPKYYAEHIVSIIVDEDKQLVTVGEERLKNFSPQGVVESVKAQIKRLKVDPARLGDFLGELFEAYKKLTSGQDATIPLWELYRELVIGRQPRKLWRDATSANFRPFTEMEFRAHLTALLKADRTTVSSHQLRLLPPVSKDESLYVYQPAENRFAHVGRVQFIPTTGGEIYE